MLRTTTGLTATILATLAACSVAHAQTCYVNVEPARPEPGSEIRVRVVSGEPFAGSPLSTGPTREVEIERLWRSGRAGLQPVDGDATATFRPGGPGTQLVAFRPATDAGGEGADVASFGKALVVVGEASPHETIWRSELGHRLEIVPETDPVTLAARGGGFEVQVLFRREPLPGATIVAVAEGAAAASYRRGVTDAMGRVRFELDRPGRWLVHLAHKSFEREATRGWTLYESSLLLTSGP